MGPTAYGNVTALVNQDLTSHVDEYITPIIRQ